MAAQTSSIDGKRFVTMRFKRIKTWAHAYHVRQHNMRKMPCPHADGPAPRLLVGGDDVSGSIRALLKRHGITWKQGEVLAIEFVVSASREVFECVDEAERDRRLEALIECTRKAFDARFKIGGQIVSIALHEDETTPHIHIVVVPLVREPDLRRRDKSPQVRLSAKRVIGGQGDMAREQTRFASFFADMGLERGKEGSRARHTPNREHEAMLEESRQAALAEAKALAAERGALANERQRDEQERALWRIAAKRLTAKSEALDRRSARLDETAQRQAAEEARLLAERDRVETLVKDATALRTRALKRIYALGPVLHRSRSLIEHIDRMDASKRTQDDVRTREIAAGIETARHAAVANDDYLDGVLTKASERGGRD